VHRHSTKKFPRWLNGSCVEAQPQQVAGQDEPVFFSFFSDVSMHPAVNEVALGVQESVRGGVASLVKHISWWKKYRLLWKMQRVGVWVSVSVLSVLVLWYSRLCERQSKSFITHGMAYGWAQWKRGAF